MVLRRGEDASAHVDLDEMRIRIGSLEVRPDRRLVVADLGVPHAARLLRVADPVGDVGPVVERFRPKRRIRHRGKARHLVETQSVQVDVAEMLLRRVPRVDDPVAVDLFGEWVERAEERVWHRHLPDCSTDRLPAGDAFRALDDDVLAGGGLVGDAPLVAPPAVPGIHPFAVHTLVDDDGVSRLGHTGSAVDGPERPVFGAVRDVGADRRDVEDGCHVSLGPSGVDC